MMMKTILIALLTEINAAPTKQHGIERRTFFFGGGNPLAALFGGGGSTKTEEHHEESSSRHEREEKERRYRESYNRGLQQGFGSVNPAAFQPVQPAPQITQGSSGSNNASSNIKNDSNINIIIDAQGNVRSTGNSQGGMINGQAIAANGQTSQAANQDIYIINKSINVNGGKRGIKFENIEGEDLNEIDESLSSESSSSFSKITRIYFRWVRISSGRMVRRYFIKRNGRLISISLRKDLEPNFDEEDGDQFEITGGSSGSFRTSRSSRSSRF